MGLYKGALKGDVLKICVFNKFFFKESFRCGSTIANCSGAKTEVQELKVLLEKDTILDSDSDLDPSGDFSNEEEDIIAFDPEELTDLEDLRKEENNIPCHHYNHAGCLGRSECAFSHTKEDLSVHDCMFIPLPKYCFKIIEIL